MPQRRDLCCSRTCAPPHGSLQLHHDFDETAHYKQIKRHAPFPAGRGGSEKSLWISRRHSVPLGAGILVTALVPSDTGYLASFPGNSRHMTVCTSEDVMAERVLYCARREASLVKRSNLSFTYEFMMPVFGCTCFSTLHT